MRCGYAGCAPGSSDAGGGVSRGATPDCSSRFFTWQAVQCPVFGQSDAPPAATAAPVAAVLSTRAGALLPQPLIAAAIAMAMDAPAFGASRRGATPGAT